MSKKNNSHNSVYIYVSECCKVQANKPPCERSREEITKGDWAQSPLGTWNCGKCGRKCGVTRHRRDKVQEPNNSN